MVEMRQAENKVRIEGILAENDIDYGSYVKNGKTVECIRGTIKVLVEQTINGADVVNEIPVSMFSAKFKNDGKPNPAYESIEKIKNEFTSIAAAGGKAGADGIRITGAQMGMNEYFNPNGQLVAFPRIRASFAQKVAKDKLKPEATFVAEMVVADQKYRTDADGIEVEPKVYEIKGVIPGFGGTVDVMDFVCSNENVIAAVSNYWENGSTVKAAGRLNFTSTTEEYTEAQGFGEPIVRTRTINVSDLVITGGSPDPLEGEFAYTNEQISAALAERKNKLEKLKAEAGNKTRKAPAPANTVSNAALDLGF